MITSTQQDIVAETVQFFVDMANEALCESRDRTPLNSLTIGYDLKGTTAGTANYYSKKVKFNKVLIEENFEHFINDTIPHEVAHIVTYYFYGDNQTAHGKAWKYVMSHVFGVKPERCHSLDTTNSRVRNTKKFIYTCPCNKTFNLSSNRHKKIQEWGFNRLCSTCKGRLVFTGNKTDKFTLMAQDKSNK